MYNNTIRLKNIKTAGNITNFNGQLNSMHKLIITLDKKITVLGKK